MRSLTLSLSSRLLSCLLLLGLLGSPIPAPAQAAAALPAIEHHPLEIGAGDLLDVSLLDTPELSARLRVDERGAVLLPLAGALQLSGMTAEQAAHAVESRFRDADIVLDPHVSLTILEYATQGVVVLGEVKNPGVYPLLGDHGLLDLISAAGGVTPTAGKAVSVTHHADPSHPVIVRVETNAGSAVAFNVDIEPRDIIMVSRAGIVYVVGDVGRPGGFLIENNDRLTVLQAIALAQGANKTAALNRAKLIRKLPTGREELPVPLKRILANQAEDQALDDGDILFVPSSQQKSAAYRGMEAALQMATGVIVYGRY